MILYCDTSALVKRYVVENSSDKVDALWEDALEIATSVVTFAETLATFSRKFREDVLAEVEYMEIIKVFKEDYARLILVPVSLELNKIIEDLLIKYSLRGFDSIHLASALLIRKKSNLITKFACFDQALNIVAVQEQLDVPFSKKTI